jgi:hypothetical protein
MLYIDLFGPVAYISIDDNKYGPVVMKCGLWLKDQNKIL